MVHLVSVDGGGSRCRMAAMSSDGTTLARITIEKHASLSAGVEDAWAHISSGLADLRRQLAQPSDWWPDTLVMGLAGSLHRSRRQSFLDLVPQQISAILVTDGVAQLWGACAGKPGVCLAVGTGSVVHWLDQDGKTGMAGGWGFPAGDQGSGAWLGMRALQLYIEYRDGYHKRSSLIEALEQKIGDEISDIQTWTTEVRASVMAQLAPMVFVAAQAGDKAAASVVDQAVQYCIKLIDCAPADLPVCVVGGVGQQLQSELTRTLGSRFTSSQGDALEGLYRLSAQQPA